MAAQSEHPHPNRYRKAKMAARWAIMIGVALIVLGLAAILTSAPGSATIGLVSTIVVIGVVLTLVTPTIYFTYMEGLEPDLYGHES